MKEPTLRLARWSLLLSEYDFEIIHKVRKANANVTRCPKSRELIRPEQEYDPRISAVKREVKLGREPSYFIDQDRVLYKFSGENRTDMLVVPVKMQTKVFTIYHNLAFARHKGIMDTYELIKSMFSGRECTEISQNSFSKDRHRYCRRSAYNQGNKYILNFQDAFSKYPEVVCLPDQNAKTIARAFVTEVVARHGAPEKLLSD
ncbi:hypothetical protein PR048_023506 [Dryococelus australis]|uniref:Reverse transcriptase n=1 Tax=Dryococelus australis TaxID=614101 RepID=A0ABQ9GUB1_9NEOP|nr:hypothetical protein PR048_023506 [Dryococelus australis]